MDIDKVDGDGRPNAGVKDEGELLGVAAPDGGERPNEHANAGNPSANAEPRPGPSTVNLDAGTSGGVPQSQNPNGHFQAIELERLMDLMFEPCFPGDTLRNYAESLRRAGNNSYPSPKDAFPVIQINGDILRPTFRFVYFTDEDLFAQLVKVNKKWREMSNQVYKAILDLTSNRMEGEAETDYPSEESCSDDDLWEYDDL